jgi:hypothetical protein
VVVGVAAAVTSEGCHESERARDGASRDGAASRSPILRRAAPGVSAILLTPRRVSALRAEAAGGVAQLGERLLCKQEVIGSIPFTSTISRRLMVPRQR